MPLHGVGRLQHPVVLVREEQQSALHPLPLQGRERRQPLGIGHPVVERAVRHQHRRAPLRDVRRGVELLVDVGRLVVRPAVLPFREPEFLGGVVHRARVEDARVVDDAAEAVRPLARDPVLHEAAVRRAERAGLPAIQPVVARQRRIEALLQVDEGLAAPVLADRVGEFLPVARGTVEVDEHHRIAAPGEGLRVPAPAPLVAEAHLGAAVHQERDRILAPRHIAMRLDHVAVDLLVVPARKAELLELAERTLAQQVRVDAGQPAQGRGFTRRQEQVGGRRQRRPRNHGTAGRRRELRDLSLADDAGRATRGRIDGEQRVLPDVVRGGQQLAAVVTGGQAAH